MIGVVLNPHAGTNRGRPQRAERLRKIVGTHGLVRVTEDLGAVEDVAAEFAEAKVDLLAVCGGDGSHYRMLTAWRKVAPATPIPRYLPLRAGTMNYIARSIRCIRGGPEHVLAHVMRDYGNGGAHDIVERQLLVVNDVHTGFVLGCGVIVNYLQLYYAQPRPGVVTAARLLGRLIASGISGSSLARGVFRRVEADIDCDGERVPFRVFTVILAGTVTHVALGFKPMYLAGRKRHYFHLLAGPIGPFRLTRKLKLLYCGQPLEEEEFYDNLARSVTVTFGAPTPFMMDGDVLDGASRLTIETGPTISMIRG